MNATVNVIKIYSNILSRDFSKKNSTAKRKHSTPFPIVISSTSERMEKMYELATGLI